MMLVWWISTSRADQVVKVEKMAARITRTTSLTFGEKLSLWKKYREDDRRPDSKLQRASPGSGVSAWTN